MSAEDIEATETLASSVESLLVEKRLLAEKERELIRHLQKMLNRIGYEVVPVSRSRRKTQTDVSPSAVPSAEPQVNGADANG